MSSGIETNKIVGAILTALLVTVAIGHFGSALFGSGGHGEAVLAYPVSSEGAVEVAPEPVVIPTVLPLLADASAADGEALFAACKACHTNTDGGANGVGPALWGVVGRDVASHEGYSYSDALSGIEGNWTYEQLNHFLLKPSAFAPGTKMGFAGLPNVNDRADVIAYLRTLDASPVALPTQDEIDAALAEESGGGEEGTAEEGAGAEGATDEGATDEGATDGGAAPDAGGDGEAAPDEGAGEGGEQPAPEGDNQAG